MVFFPNRWNSHKSQRADVQMELWESIKENTQPRREGHTSKSIAAALSADFALTAFENKKKFVNELQLWMILRWFEEKVSMNGGEDPLKTWIELVLCLPWMFQYSQIHPMDAGTAGSRRGLR